MKRTQPPKTVTARARRKAVDVTIKIRFNPEDAGAWDRLANVLGATLTHEEQQQLASDLRARVAIELQQQQMRRDETAPAPENWKEWDRETVRRAIEQATGQGLSVADPLPDTLIAAAQTIGLPPVGLGIWLKKPNKTDWSADALSHWAHQNNYTAAARCGHCDAPVDDPEKHTCQPAADTPESAAAKARTAREVMDQFRAANEASE